MDIDASLRALEAGLRALPSAIIVAALLGGPTAIWLLYRYFVQPRTSRYRTTPTGRIWICRSCHSANELASSRCYRCRRELDEIDLYLILSGLGASIPADQSAATAGFSLPDRAAEPHPATAVRVRAPVAVGPGKTRTAPRRRTVVVEGSEPGAPELDDPVAAAAPPRRSRKR